MSEEFKDAKLVADFWRNGIMPYMHNRLHTNMAFEDYIGLIYAKNSNIYLDFIPYIYSLDFIKTFQSKCVAYYAVIINNILTKYAIYQISPKLHLLASIKYWKGDNDNYTGMVQVEKVIYQNEKEFLQFVDDNMNLVKQDEEKKGVGFAA